MTSEQKAAHERMVNILPSRIHRAMPDHLSVSWKVSLKMEKEWIALRRQGKNCHEIGEMYGVNKGTISAHTKGKV
jgi:hypothetical protein